MIFAIRPIRGCSWINSLSFRGLREALEKDIVERSPVLKTTVLLYQIAKAIAAGNTYIHEVLLYRSLESEVKANIN